MPKLGSIDNSLSEAFESAICDKHKTRKRKYNGGARCIECEDEEYYEAKRKERELKAIWKKKSGTEKWRERKEFKHISR